MNLTKASSWMMSFAAVLLAIIVANEVNMSSEFAEDGSVAMLNLLTIAPGSSIVTAMGVIAFALLTISGILSAISRSKNLLMACSAACLTASLLFSIYLESWLMNFLIYTGITAGAAAVVVGYLGKDKLTKIPPAPDAPDAAMTAAEGSSEQIRT